MHLHCHLKEVILDHGPVTGFWCFSFERFNGVLGSTPTNNQSVELQIMRRFTISRYFGKTNLPSDYQNEFTGLCTVNTTNVSEIAMQDTDWETTFQLQNIPTVFPIFNIDWLKSVGIKPPTTYKISTFDNDDPRMLLNVYVVMFPDTDIQLPHLSECITKYGSITIGPVRYGSKLEPQGIRSSNILPSWPSNVGNILKGSFKLTAGTVKFFFSHSLQMGSVFRTFYFACVQWYIADEKFG